MLKQFCFAIALASAFVGVSSTSQAQGLLRGHYNLTLREGNRVTPGTLSLRQHFGHSAVYFGQWNNRFCNYVSLQQNGFNQFYLNIDGCNNGGTCSGQLTSWNFGQLNGRLYCASGSSFDITLY